MSLNFRKSVQSIEGDENELEETLEMHLKFHSPQMIIGAMVILLISWSPIVVLLASPKSFKDYSKRTFFPSLASCLHVLARITSETMCNDPTVTIPYWDWRYEDSKTEGIPKAYAEKQINGDKNPLYNFHIYVPSARLDEDTKRDPNTQILF